MRCFEELYAHAPSPPAEFGSLHAELRARTAAAHADAEASSFLEQLLAGKLATEGLTQLLACYLPIYTALEAQAAHWSRDPDIGPFHVEGLARTPALQQDLQTLGGTESDGPAIAAYVARIQATEGRRAAYVAQHYTRYLGDLSGGQVMRVALQRSLDVDATNGASFFAFPGLVPGKVRDTYRIHLDTVAWTRAEREELIEEALVAYPEIPLGSLTALVGGPFLRARPSQSRPRWRLGMSAQLRGVTVHRGGKDVLSDVHLEVHPGELLALIGPNGAGKSTLLAVLAGDLKPSKGTVVLGDDPVDELSTAQLARRRSMLVQQSTIAFPFTVESVVRMGRALWRSRQGKSRTNTRCPRPFTRQTFSGWPISPSQR